MKWSLFLGKPWGIKLYIHWTFLILIAWVLYTQLSQGTPMPEALIPIGFVLAVFACVTLHEYGHALAARRFGVGTKQITLLPIGGVASLEKIPEKPREELIVAAAGPLVNVAIALVLAGLLYALGIPLLPSGNGESISGSNFLASLLAVNIILVLFNLIPAFPMDGGRMLRALLALRMDRTVATRWAASIGQFFAILFALGGLLVGNPFLIFIGVFIYLGAQAEYQNVSSTSLLEGYKVRDITMHSFTPIHPFDRLEKVVRIMLDGQEDHFVVLDNDQVVGTLSKREIISGLNKGGEEIAVQQVMNKAVQAVDPEQPLEDAMLILQQQKGQVVPVVQAGRFVGMLDLENISEFLLVQTALKQREDE
ncbi:MAG: site-2 protease family protein [Bacteroidota bacterium]